MGRKKIPKPIRLNFLVPSDKEQEVRSFINAIQQEAISKESIVNHVNQNKK